MKVNVELNDNIIVGYITYPINTDKPYVELDSIPNDLLSGEYKYENGQVLKNGIIVSNDLVISSCLTDDLLAKKESVIKAFNAYKADVVYGIVLEDEVAHELIINWYNLVCSNDVNSINNPPAILIKYMEV